MQDMYLKFKDEAEAQSILYTEVPTAWDDEGNVTESYSKPNYANIDTIGIIYNDDAVLDDDGNVVTPATPMDGWHCNIRVVDGEDVTPLQPYAVTVNSPLRVWG